HRFTDDQTTGCPGGVFGITLKCDWRPDFCGSYPGKFGRAPLNGECDNDGEGDDDDHTQYSCRNLEPLGERFKDSQDGTLSFLNRVSCCSVFASLGEASGLNVRQTGFSLNPTKKWTRKQSALAKPPLGSPSF